MLAEALLIAAPAVLAAPRPKRESLRVQWPGWRLCILSVVLGATLWPLSAALSALSAVLFPSPGATLPQVYPSVSFLVAVTIFPAICEELLFRGYIQPAYERRGARFGILIPALLFLCFHLSSRRFAELIPAALLLGYLAWSTHSVVPGMFAHFAMNALSAAWAVAATLGRLPESPQALLAIAVAVAMSPLVTLAALWAVRRSVSLAVARAPRE